MKKEKEEILDVSVLDYTKERHQWLDEKTLANVLLELKALPEDDTNQYDEIIE